MARRGRKLDEERSEHILGSVLEVLHDVGYDQMRMQDVADRAGVGLSTIYRRWPTKQDLVRASLECDQATEKYVVTGDPRADVQGLPQAHGRGPERQGRADDARVPRPASGPTPRSPRSTARRRSPGCRSTCASRLAAELGEDFPDLDLRATAGPAILIYQSAVCGQPFDAEAMATRLTDLLFAPLPAELTQPAS